MDSSILKTDVTALKFFGNYVLAGVGNFLMVYNTTFPKLILKKEVFKGQKIHGIIPRDDKTVAIFGGKCVCVMELTLGENVRSDTIVKWQAVDWVHALLWLNGGTHSVLLTAHNAVSLWDSAQGNCLDSRQCQELCILYSGCLLGSSWDDLIVLAGTVYQEVLIWSPHDRGTVLGRLQGHDGVIFSVIYDKPSRLVITTSDDRTVRLWHVEMTTVSGGAAIEPSYTLYGHTARVWRCVVLRDCLVSAGEDSQLCVWSRDGALQHRWEAHRGAPIWSLDVLNEVVVSGGGDGAIYWWPVTKKARQTVPVLLTPCPGTPRRIAATPKGSILVCTEEGCLFEYVSDRGWRLRFHSESFAGYCLLEVCRCCGCVAVASIGGLIALLCSDRQGGDPNELKVAMDKFSAADGKIFSLHWLEDHHLLTCGPSGLLRLWKWPGCGNILESVTDLVLPESHERWTTAATLQKDCLVVADRKGSLYRYSLRRGLCHTLTSTHGHSGATSLTWTGACLLQSTGRDGVIRQYDCADQGTLQPLRSDRLPVEWVAMLTSGPVGDTLALGFRGLYFVVWSVKEKRVLVEVACGGGHRCWDFLVREKDIMFTFLKNKRVQVVHQNWSDLLRISLQSGVHQKSINCAFLLKGRETLLVSGGEDNLLLIQSVSGEEQLRVELELGGHISSIRAVSAVTLSHSIGETKHLLVSAGGRAQLKVWELTTKNTAGEIQYTCREITTHNLRGDTKRRRKPWRLMGPEPDPETRYMDVCLVTGWNKCRVLIAVACSDGHVRLFRFCVVEVELVATLAHHSCCVLRLHHLNLKGRDVIVSMASDGRAMFWDLSLVMRSVEGHHTALLSPFHAIKLHQSGINSCDVIISEDRFVLATGGDDNSLVLSLFHSSLDEADETLQIERTEKWINESTHAAQITGLSFVDNCLLSVSVDQRVTLWQFCGFGQPLRAEFVDQYCSTVADIKGCVAWTCDNKIRVCVHGEGMEVIDIEYCSLRSERMQQLNTLQEGKKVDPEENIK